MSIHARINEFRMTTLLHGSVGESKFLKNKNYMDDKDPRSVSNSQKFPIGKCEPLTLFMSLSYTLFFADLLFCAKCW